MAFAPPARRRSQSSLRVVCSRINKCLTRTRNDGTKQDNISSIHDLSASTISTVLGPTGPQVVDEKCTPRAKKSPLSPQETKGEQLLTEQIAISKRTLNKKQLLARAADELAREVERIKRREMESRLVYEKQMVFQKKHDAAHSIRAANYDAYKMAKKQRDFASAERDEKMRREKEMREVLLLQAQMKKRESAKKQSEMMKSEMLANDLRIERDRVSLTMSNAAKAHKAREQREQKKELLRSDKFVQVTNQRWSHESDRQDRCAQSIENTLRAIKIMKEEKTTLETPRGAAARQAAADAVAARLEKDRVRIREAKQKKHSQALHVAAARQASVDTVAIRLEKERIQIRETTNEKRIHGRTLFSDTASSNAKHTPRSSSVGRIRNRYGNWEEDKSKLRLTDEVDKSQPSSPGPPSELESQEDSQGGFFIPEDRSRSLNHKEAQWFVTEDKRYYETPSVATDCQGNWIQVGLAPVVEQSTKTPSCAVRRTV
eukprot:GEMP01033498.1.p1 GENE.GEMP01033498.1~~GEMP01033498.1.p1  ORF type:complete len:489 (+),score=111.17 GEMP01033498.1:272-1738(+)